MAQCPSCGHLYGLFKVRRRPSVQSCPSCGWDPTSSSSSDDDYDPNMDPYHDPRSGRGSRYQSGGIPGGGSTGSGSRGGRGR